MQYTTNYNIPKYDGTDLLNPTSREGLNSGNDIIDTQLKNNADAILTKANDSAVIKGVKVAGTELTKDSDGKVNVPYATDSAGGVVKVSSGYGTGMSSDGIIRTVKAENGDIDAKTNVYRPIVPSKLDYAILKGLESNSQIDTATKKKAICNTIGATFDGQFELIEKITCNGTETSITRNATPNSVSYNFSKLLITFELPASSTLTNGVQIYANSEHLYNGNPQIKYASAVVKGYVILNASEGINEVLASGGGSYNNSQPLYGQCIEDFSNILNENKKYTTIRFVLSNSATFVENTKIKIYGVWA